MKRRTAGFTLIELLIVVAIIGILAAIAIPNFLEAQTRAKVAKSVSNLRNLSLFLEEYAIDTKNYPPWLMAYMNPPADAFIPFHFLTTPVEYVSSFDQVRDEFSQSNIYSWYRLPGASGPAGWSMSNCCWTDNFDGVSNNGDQGFGWLFLINGTPPVGDVWGANSGNAYALYGTGPLGGVFLNTAANMVPYDPTNGTVSEGRIWRYGP